jgi:hypothetical protein
LQTTPTDTREERRGDTREERRGDTREERRHKRGEETQERRGEETQERRGEETQERRGDRAHFDRPELQTEQIIGWKGCQKRLAQKRRRVKITCCRVVESHKQGA